MKITSTRKINAGSDQQHFEALSRYSVDIPGLIDQLIAQAENGEVPASKVRQLLANVFDELESYTGDIRSACNTSGMTAGNITTETDVMAGNPLTGKLPAKLDQFLEDAAQIFTTLDYSDIAYFAESATKEDIQRLKEFYKFFSQDNGFFVNAIQDPDSYDEQDVNEAKQQAELLTQFVTKGIKSATEPGNDLATLIDYDDWAEVLSEIERNCKQNHNNYDASKASSLLGWFFDADFGDGNLVNWIESAPAKDRNTLMEMGKFVQSHGYHIDNVEGCSDCGCNPCECESVEGGLGTALAVGVGTELVSKVADKLMGSDDWVGTYGEYQALTHAIEDASSYEDIGYALDTSSDGILEEDLRDMLYRCEQDGTDIAKCISLLSSIIADYCSMNDVVESATTETSTDSDEYIATLAERSLAILEQRGISAGSSYDDDYLRIDVYEGPDSDFVLSTYLQPVTDITPNPEDLDADAEDLADAVAQKLDAEVNSGYPDIGADFYGYNE